MKIAGTDNRIYFIESKDTDIAMIRRKYMAVLKEHGVNIGDFIVNIHDRNVYMIYNDEYMIRKVKTADSKTIEMLRSISDEAEVDSKYLDFVDDLKYLDFVDIGDKVTNTDSENDNRSTDKYGNKGPLEERGPLEQKGPLEWSQIETKK